MSGAHKFQRKLCQHAIEHNRVPILNAACKEDPAKLGLDYDAINLDITDYDPHTKVKLTDLKNYKQGNILEASSIFEPETFGMIVLGEFIEHCVFEAAAKALTELRAVLNGDGFMVLTFPLDSRPPGKQHAKHHLVVTVEGETGHDITVWHQTVWEDDMLAALFEETGFKETSRTKLHYGFCADRGGWGLTLEKR